jgi:Family of unknown function (DUF6169)
LSDLYEVIKALDGLSYQFVTSSGNHYIAYFTEFILQEEHGNELPVVSFGFSCKNESKRHDPKIKNTLIHILNEFFTLNPNQAVFYICVNSDYKARNRYLTFNNWFNEEAIGLDKYEVKVKDSSNLGFYSSIIIKSNNPLKIALKDAFYYTHEFWGLI